MTSAAPAPDYLVLGHLTLDETPAGSVLGGTAAYAALTAKALGLQPAIVTAADTRLDLSQLAGVPLHRFPSAQTTIFRNVYGEGGRRQQLRARAAELTEAAVPPAWRAAAIVHLAPVAGEMPASMAEIFPGAEVVGLTPQGWLRAWDENGWISFGSWQRAIPAMERADVVILGTEDVDGRESELEGMASACRLLVVTEGPLGARVYWNGDVRRFAPPPTDPVDPTGAGDIFAAAFFIRYRQTRDPWEAARFANVLASASVARTGLAGVPTPEQARQAAMVWTR